MALLQISSISSFNASSSSPPQPPYISPFPHSSSIKAHLPHHNSFLSFSAITTRDRLFSLSTHPRKLLCRPPHGKYVREDYLVVGSFHIALKTLFLWNAYFMIYFKTLRLFWYIFCGLAKNSEFVLNFGCFLFSSWALYKRMKFIVFLQLLTLIYS